MNPQTLSLYLGGLEKAYADYERRCQNRSRKDAPNLFERGGFQFFFWPYDGRPLGRCRMIVHTVVSEDGGEAATAVWRALPQGTYEADVFSPKADVLALRDQITREAAKLADSLNQLARDVDSEAVLG